MAYTTDPNLSYEHGSSIREDLLDFVSIMSPVQTPLLQFLPDYGPARSRQYDWLADYIASPEESVAAGSYGSVTGHKSAVPEGADAEFPVAQDLGRLANYPVIVSRTVSVSGSMREFEQAGIEDMYDYNTFQAMVKAAEQLDWNFHWGQFSAGNAGAPTRMTHGVCPWIYWTGASVKTGATVSTVTIAGQAVPISGPGSRAGFSGTVFTGAGTDFTRANFNDSMLEPSWRRGMTIAGSVAFMGGKVKGVFSTFALSYDGVTGTNDLNLNERTIAAQAKEIVDTVDAYGSDYGTVYAVLDRHMTSTTTQTWDTGDSPGDDIITPNSAMLIIEPAHWGRRTVRDLHHSPLAKVGDADNGQCIVEAGVQAGNPIAGIFAYDIAA